MEISIGIGLAGAVVPVYIAETAPANRLGELAAIPQTLVSTGKNQRNVYTSKSKGQGAFT